MAKTHKSRSKRDVPKEWIDKLKTYYNFDDYTFGKGKEGEILKKWDTYTIQKCAKEVASKADPVQLFFSK